MGVAIAALIVSIILIVPMPLVGVPATVLCAIWVVLAFVTKVLGWTLGGLFGGSSKRDD